jgi:predicted nucleotidyltransferase
MYLSLFSKPQKKGIGIIRMESDEILSLLKKHRKVLSDMGVQKLALFGSAARGEVHADSDVDLLVEFVPPVTFDQYMRVKFYLEDLLRRPVDLVIPETLKEYVRPNVEKEAIYVT